MGTSVVVNHATFEAEVLQKSFEKPVLVDFYAQWCGPCKLLKPMLEKLVQEYDFVLAKVDIDENPDLANAFAVEGVPDVRVVQNGQMQNGFVGVLPEPQLRQFLVDLNLTSARETGLEAIQVAKAAGEWEEVEKLFVNLAEQYPEDKGLAMEAAQFLISRQKFDEAQKALAEVSPHDREFGQKVEALRSLIQLHQDSETLTPASDLDTHYLKAVQLTLAEDYEAALQSWLELVARDRKYRQDAARKTMLTIFALLGDDHALTMAYRRKLMSTLY
ncbi:MULTISPECIES: tetratricopeptide repeat protein [unclassified Leptolyngbya]|uniref:tetratricopeptide repeat protein n=1 Tax=unclassified Leptolyngbya TaxID=2650499 RepID=UPI001681DC38|nr:MULTISPECIES: tetratricopeptide repeat protein [unclassified Leptolyngbya]MBD1910993.1 tetratricopeptide repeat protein [Leptolyngbya sp. FACHB-8]MBD2158340.1 tetratricopeptide repeat protein [Leptolyngbya sp. FACHB-16]